MGRFFLWAAAVLVCGHVALASVDVTYEYWREGSSDLWETLDPGDEVWESTDYELRLYLTNDSPATTALSAYQFNFEGGDFATGKLDTTNWAEASVFDTWDDTPDEWLSLDQSLDTASLDFVVDGVTGSQSTSFAGPGLPLGTAVLIGTFDVYIDASAGEFVDFLLSDQSGIDDQDGNFGGAGIASFGITDVVVVPEPGTLGLLLLSGLLASPSRRRF
ncbi:MAG: PEP-CTERM sorting domain-containing protein [bacterium]|nr:PEP-CTERM sorting domain-containing protein [bacterium]